MRGLLSPRRVQFSRGVARVSRGAGRAGRELLRRRDLEVLGWLAEQYGARVDHLEVLLGAGPRTVQRTVARSTRGGSHPDGTDPRRRARMGAPDQGWDGGCNSGFGVWRPRLGSLSHVAAVNDVRLHIQSLAPATEWIPERMLARDRRAGEHLPDGVAITDGTHVAIEVELTVKSRRRVTAILDELTSRFDATLYFCAPGPQRQLTELSESSRWPSWESASYPHRRPAIQDGGRHEHDEHERTEQGGDREHDHTRARDLRKQSSPFLRTSSGPSAAKGCSPPCTRAARG